MSKIITIIFICLFNTLDAQQIKTITEKHQHFLRSYVSEIDSFDIKGRLVKFTNCYGKRCKESTIYKYIYNEKGQLTDSYIIEQIGEKDSILNHHIYICHDENSLTWNKETTEECIQRYDYPTVWHWNKNGQLLRITVVDSFDLKNLDFPFYNSYGTMNNLIIERSHIKGSLDYLCKIDYEYKEALLTKSTYNYYKNNKQTATSIYYYVYDSLKRISKKIIVDKGFIALNYITISSYDWNEDRLASSIWQQDEDGEAIKKEITFYEYDDNYNLIKTTKKQLLPKEKILSKMRYKYEYYDK